MTQMADQMADQPGQEAGADGLAGYMDALGEAPLLGYFVLYSIFDGNVTPEELARWFAELDLDPSMLPSALRADGAFETVTSSTQVTYDIPAGRPAAAADPPGAKRRKRARKRADQTRTATLMVRRVRRDDDTIVCHVVREVRDAGATKLSYTTRVAEVIFHREQHGKPGAGRLEIISNPGAIPAREHAHLDEILTTLDAQFERHCRYLTGDKIRVMIRAYVESLRAIRVRATGGVYFVHHRHDATLAALHTLIERFGAGSHLYRVPLPDQDEMRVMVIEAFRTKARADLQKLAAEIAAAQAAARNGTPISTKATEALYRKFQTLQAEAGEHSELLSADVDDTTAAMQLVSTQLAGLLAQAG